MKIIIMGAGLLGVTTAYFLGRQGHEVIVLERQQGPALETSFANGGMITPSQADPWNKPGIFRKLLAWMGDEDAPFLLRANAVLPLLGWGISFIRNSGMQRYLLNMHKNAKLAAYSLNILKQLRQQHGMHYDETDKGTLKIYKDDKTWEWEIEENSILDFGSTDTPPKQAKVTLSKESKYLDMGGEIKDFLASAGRPLNYISEAHFLKELHTLTYILKWYYATTS